MGGWLQFAMRPDALMGRTDMDGHLFFQQGGWEKSIFGVFASPSPLDSSACANFGRRCDVTSATLYLPPSRRRKFSTLLGSLQSTESRP